MNIFLSVVVVVLKDLIYIGEGVCDDLELSESVNLITGYFLKETEWDASSGEGILLRNLTAFLTSLNRKKSHIYKCQEKIVWIDTCEATKDG